MHRLYRAALAEAGHALPPEGPVPPSWQPPHLNLTVDLYRRLGGAGRILGEYVGQALAGAALVDLRLVRSFRPRGVLLDPARRSTVSRSSSPSTSWTRTSCRSSSASR